MIITPLALAQLSSLIYTQTDGWDHYWTIDDVVVAHKVVDGTDVIVHRGSLVTEDWVRDFTAIPEWHPQLGYCHSGMLEGMDSVFEAVRKVAGKSVVITGHSLGGGRSRILAGLFACNKLPVEALCTFGSPKPAFINLARIIQKSGMSHSSYRNRNDIVPTLPLSIEPFLDFVHTEKWTSLNAPPAQDNLQALRDHSIQLYIDGLQK